LQLSFSNDLGLMHSSVYNNAPAIAQMAAWIQKRLSLTSEE